jgi:hypothetical protein
MNRFIIVLLLCPVYAAPSCATYEELKNEDNKTAYYLRFLSKTESNTLGEENAFGTDTLPTWKWKYIGYAESTDDYVKLKVEKKLQAAQFFIQGKQENGNGFKVYSKDKKLPTANQQRILSWNQGYSGTGTGYYMYITQGKSYTYTPNYVRFDFDDATKSLSAGDVKKTLGIYEAQGYTAIYREANRGAKANFCFEKVPLKCPVKDINIKDKNAEFPVEIGCDEADSVGVNKVCTAQCTSPYVPVGASKVDYTCGQDGTWKTEKDIQCEIKEEETKDEEKNDEAAVKKELKNVAAFNKLHVDFQKQAEDADVKKFSDSTMAFQNEMKTKINSLLKDSKTENARKYQKDAAEKEKIQKYIAEELKSKTCCDVTGDDVEKELAKYYKGNSIAQLSALGALVCLMVLHY